jgi:hypothetical protein
MYGRNVRIAGAYVPTSPSMLNKIMLAFFFKGNAVGEAPTKIFFLNKNPNSRMLAYFDKTIIVCQLFDQQ